MAVSLEKVRKNRSVARSAVTRLANEFDQLLSARPIDAHKVQVSWELLHPKYEELKVLDAEVYELLLEESTEQELLAEIESADNYKRKFIHLRVSYEEITNNMEAAGNKAGDGRASTVSEIIALENPGRRKFKLPKIEFKCFDGNIKDWLPFWSQFRKIHEDPDVNECDKIEYLIQATVPNSRARQLVGSFPAIAGNYEKIVRSLQSRFGREDLQIEVYVRELLKLILNNAMSHQNLDLCTLYDQIETQLRALETLGITAENCAAILFPLIESCLPQVLLKVWQRSAFSVSNTLPTAGEPGGVDDMLASGLESNLQMKLRGLLRFLKLRMTNGPC